MKSDTRATKMMTKFFIRDMVFEGSAYRLIGLGFVSPWTE